MDVRPATRADVARLAQVLAEAFESDPFSRWLFGTHEGLVGRLRTSFDGLMRHAYFPKGQSFTTGDLAGAALWAPPGRWKLTAWQQLRLAPMYLRVLGTEALRRAAPANAMIEQAHPSEPHWHLAVLGVEPARQRTGVGSAFMRTILDRADAERTLAYLETTRDDNVAYYERFGFSVTTEMDFPNDGPHMWTMTRRPA